jgi:sugar lactone lactonase YvrE
MTRHLARLRTATAAGTLALVVAVVGAPTAEARGGHWPDVIALPDGFNPEGVATGAGTSVVVGSLRDGDIWRGDLRTGEGEVLVDAPAGRIAVGLKVHRPSRTIVVAGGPLGKAFLYDARTGADRGEVVLTTETDTFVNDVALVPGGAWFTDSRRPVLYFLPLDRDGDPGPVRELALSGGAAQTPGAFNLNGIAASPDGCRLVVAHSALEALFVVDPGTGATQAVDLDGRTLPNADGILLDGRRLWVVQNFLNQVTEIATSRDLTHGTVVSVRTDPDFRVPTTIARKGPLLVAVNARFDLGMPPPADAEYELVVLRR